ncbi:MAG: Uma2 family endonuclease [Myxococcota bacterium]
MTSAKRLHYSYDDYLELLSRSDFKLEYCDGVIYAMAGGTIAHGMLAAAAIRALGQALLGRCTILSSDAKVRVEATDLSTFPDASIVCGDVASSTTDRHAVVNPALLVEVTSRSTEDYDRGDKLSHYKQIPSLKAVIFVSHRTRALTIVARSEKGWEETVVRGGEQLLLAEPALRVPVDALYDGITLDER